MSETIAKGIELRPGNCLDVLAAMEDCGVDCCVTDPPYHLTSIVKRFGSPDAAPAKDGKTGAYKRASAGFMGKQWDGGDIAFCTEVWAHVLRVLKPGGHLLAFSGTRTYHRMACAIEDAGFEIRDQIGWAYGSGFPKSHDVSKGIDRAAGAEREVVGTRVSQGGRSGGNNEFSVVLNQDKQIEMTSAATDEARQWQGWGTALKPAWEPIVLARKPLIGTVAENVLAHGTGALNIDGCRVASGDENPSIARRNGAINHLSDRPAAESEAEGRMASRQSPEAFRAKRDGELLGRWPANIIHDGSDEVVGAFPNSGPPCGSPKKTTTQGDIASPRAQPGSNAAYVGDTGSAARFFYTAKADADDRLGSKHPTVKPLDLMQWLVRLVTPPGGLVLDPFAGTGTTGEAAWREGMRAILIEREAEYCDDIRRRMAHVLAGPDERQITIIKAKGLPDNHGPLFDEIWKTPFDFSKADPA